MPVMICWSEKESKSFRGIGADVDFRRPRRMMQAERERERKLVMMKERRTPVPATPASVAVVGGMAVQFPPVSMAMVATLFDWV